MTIATAPAPTFEILRIEHDGASSAIFTDFDFDRASLMLDRVAKGYRNTPGYTVTRSGNTLTLEHPIPGIPAEQTTAVYQIRQEPTP